MVHKLTNLIKNLVFKVENNTFVTALGDKYVRLSKKLEPQIDTLNGHIFFFLCKTRAKVKRSHKYVFGKIRVRRFVERSINEYNNQYSEMSRSVVDLSQKLDPEKSQVKYDLCKNNIGIILRANKRINARRMVNKVQMFSYIENNIHVSRTKKKYTLANTN